MYITDANEGRLRRAPIARAQRRGGFAKVRANPGWSREHGSFCWLTRAAPTSKSRSTCIRGRPVFPSGGSVSVRGDSRAWATLRGRASQRGTTRTPKRRYWDCSINHLREVIRNGMGIVWPKPCLMLTGIKYGAFFAVMTSACSGGGVGVSVLIPSSAPRPPMWLACTQSTSKCAGAVG